MTIENEFLDGSSLEKQGFSLLLGIRENEEKYQAQLDKLKFEIEGIEKDLNKRLDFIGENSDRYEQDKVADLQFNARESARARLQEIVDVKGWRKEIEATQKELEALDPGSELNQLKTTLLEIECRACIFSGAIDPLELQGYVLAGMPQWVSAVENAPIQVGIEDEILKEGQRRKLEQLKPLVFAKLQSLQKVQSSLQGACDLLMPANYYNPESDDIKKFAEG